MPETKQNFEDLHKETVKKFLSGVVIIDDQIEYCDTCLSPETTSSEPQIANDPVSQQDSAASSQVAEEENPTSADNSSINAPEMIQAFAEAGISCVTYKWNGTDPNDATEIPLSDLCNKSDVVVFDWELSRTEAYDALPLIQKLAESNANSFQYIVIYTSKTASDVISKLKDEAFPGKSPLKETKKYLDYSFSGGKSATHRIEIIKKSPNDSEFCESLIQGFSTFSQGFMRRAILSSVTSIRENIFKLLALYPNKLDKAFISHFLYLFSQKDMSAIADNGFHDYFVSSFINSVQDIVSYSELLKDDLSREAIISYCNKNEELLINIKDQSDLVTKQVAIEELLTKKTHEDLTAFLCSPGEVLSKATFKMSNLKELNSEIAVQDCSTNRAAFSKTKHPLKFGTIIKSFPTDTQEQDPEFYLCLQPLCDSIRLQKETTFPFVKLEKKKIKNKELGFLVNDGGEIINLATIKKPHQHLSSIIFSPDISTTDVRCDDNLIFKDNKKIQYQWVAELRLHHTQELAHAIANQGTRIGSDKFEWLRINSSGYK